MTIATKSLWPEFSLNEVIKSPKTILNDQAEFLAKGTKNVLTAQVKTLTHGNGEISHSFEIIAPYLNGYKYTLLTIWQKDVFLYPCRYTGQGTYSIETEEDLLKSLSEIFSNENTKKVINALISQSSESK